MSVLQNYSRFILNFSQTACCLSELLNPSFFGTMNMRNLLKLSSSDAVLKPFSLHFYSVVITDASAADIKAVWEQEGRPVLCVSRRLSKAEQGYSQTHREALGVYWAIMRLHEYLFGAKLTVITDHEALNFVYDSQKSLARSSAAMVQRWSIALSAYDYDIVHRSAKQIQHADYLSRNASESDDHSDTCLLVQLMPVSRE